MPTDSEKAFEEWKEKQFRYLSKIDAQDLKECWLACEARHAAREEKYKALVEAAHKLVNVMDPEEGSRGGDLRAALAALDGGGE